MTETRRGVLGSIVAIGGSYLLTRSGGSGDGDLIGGGGSTASLLVVSSEAAQIEWESATLRGNLADLGGAATVDVSFLYGPVGGSLVETAAETRAETGEFVRSVSGLSPSTEYQFQAVARSQFEEHTGESLTFSTEAEPNIEVITTNGVEEIGETQARLFGEIIEMTNIDSAEAFFEYRPTTSESYLESARQTFASPSPYDQLIEGLESGTEYTGRAYAVSNDGTREDKGEHVTWETVSAIPDSGVSRWTFDNADTDSGTVLDSWGDNDGTINGATTGVSGANQTYNTNEAYSFGGNHVVDAGTGVLDSTQAFSVAVWVKFDLFDSQSRRIVNTNDNDNGFSLFHLSNDDLIEFRTEDAGDRQTVQTTPPSTDTWTHYVCVYNGTDNILYENGSSVGSTPSNGSGGDPEPLEIGAWSSGGEYLEGDVDDPRIYDKGLSPSEVSNLYQTGSIDG